MKKAFRLDRNPVEIPKLYVALFEGLGTKLAYISHCLFQKFPAFAAEM